MVQTVFFKVLSVEGLLQSFLLGVLIGQSLCAHDEDSQVFQKCLDSKTFGSGTGISNLAGLRVDGVTRNSSMLKSITVYEQRESVTTQKRAIHRDADRIRRALLRT